MGSSRLNSYASRIFFHQSGGGVTYEVPDPKWLDSTFSAQDGYGEWRFTGDNSGRLMVGTPLSGVCDSSACKELLVILPYIKKGICQEIASKMNMLNSGVIYQDANDIGLTKFVGTFPAASNHLGDAAGGMVGVYQGCIEGGRTPATGSYHYFQVLIAR
jgi:hypothetical protein